MDPKEPAATVVSLGSAILGPLPGEAADPPPAAPVELGAELVDGRYALERELGRGGMGVVYQGVDVTLGRPVAVKLVHPHMLAHPAVVTLFHQEARALASIRSEHVVGVYAFGTHRDSFFFSMEMVDGEPLDALISAHQASGEAIPLHRALVILRRVAAGLDEVHRVGLLHRDVKPDNILIERHSGRPVLVDFGLATAAASAGNGLLAGTPGYMAPELFTGATPGPGVDVYAFACTAFELLTGRPVFDAPTSEDLVRRHSTVDAPLLSSVRPELEPADRIMAAALSKSPGARPASCGILARSLGEALRGFALAEQIFAGSVPPPPPSVDPGLNALVVDDDPDFARLAARAIAVAFHGQPAKVVVASDGARGLELAAWKMPRLLLLDFDMPAMDGCEMLSRLRDLPGSAACRVVVISAAGARLPRYRFKLLGVEDILAKPVPFPGLLALIQDVAKRDAMPASVAPSRARR